MIYILLLKDKIFIYKKNIKKLEIVKIGVFVKIDDIVIIILFGRN